MKNGRVKSRMRLAILLVMGLAAGGSFHVAPLQAEDPGQIFEARPRLQTPRKKAPRGGGELDTVEVRIWIPDHTTVIRGAVVNPFYTKAVSQKHWRAAARFWNFAVIGANYFGVKNEDCRPTLLSALDTLAKQSGHPELKHIPFCFVGMSAGGGMSAKFTDLLPERTIAAAPVCLEVGPRSPKSRAIPMLTIFGERDGRQMEKLLAKLPNERAEQARWAIAVQWGRRHEFGQANNLILPFFDAAIRRRYPVAADPRQGPIELKEIPEDAGWLGDVRGWQDGPATIASFKEYSGDRQSACWFPDERTARTWQAFVARRPPIRIKTPAGLGDGQPFSIHAAGQTIALQVKLPEMATECCWQIGDARHPFNSSEGELSLSAGIHPLVVTAKRGKQTLHSRPHTLIVLPESARTSP